MRRDLSGKGKTLRGLLFCPDHILDEPLTGMV